MTRPYSKQVDHDRLTYPHGTDKEVLTHTAWIEYYRRLHMFMKRRNRDDDANKALEMKKNREDRKRKEARAAMRVAIEAQRTRAGRSAT